MPEAVRESNNQSTLFFISGISFFVLAFVLNYLVITSFGLAFSFFIALRFISELGKSMPLKELIVLLASLQWIIGAKISYGYESIHYKYFMYVEEAQYMGLVVPATFLFYLGLIVIKLPNLKLRLHQAVSKNLVGQTYMKRVAKNLLLLGVFGLLFGKMLNMQSLAFLFYMMSLVIYVSIGYFFFIYPQRKTLIFAAILGITFFQALSSGLFHNFFLMAIFLFTIYVDRNRSFLWKTIVIVTAVLLVNVLQVIKHDYRKVIWESGNSGGIATVYQLIENHYFSTGTSSSIYLENEGEASEDVTKVTTRINQGWIISKVMDYVPRETEFLKGESVSNALSASILPRFLFPGKTSVEDVKKTFEKVTGLTLLEGTSMGLSLVGEFYANYGVQGAWIAMFLYGTFLSLVLRLLFKLSGDSPFLVLWFVLIFFQVIKAETYLIKVLNHLIKASVFVFALRFLLGVFGLDIFPKVKTEKNC